MTLLVNLVKMRSGSRLFINHISPPGYWKEGGKRKLILVVRQDRYEVDEVRHVIFLKDWKIKVPFEGRLRWLVY
ncbi:MAG: hypothetical protein TQ35_0009060 [Candidatus Aramenus sulfurataquae]|jgi:putative transposase|uniref:Uncharacterized protein n=1 Tax=Candidatus Aramenus sulfurataquae TaxID=1326980 RepID=A0ACC6TR19_9CREN